MDSWTVIHDAVFAVVPPLEVPLPLLGVFVVLALGVTFEIRSWRQHR